MACPTIRKLVTLVLGLTACTTMIPPAKAPASREKVVGVPIGAAWTRALAFMGQNHPATEEVDTASQSVRVAWLNLTPVQRGAWLDCGAFIEKHDTVTVATLQGLDTTVEFDVSLRSQGDSTVIQVRPQILTYDCCKGIQHVHGFSVGCVSNGSFEAELVGAIAKYED